MRLWLKLIFVLVVFIITAGIFSYFYLPVNRVGITSELVMLGDLNNDNRWDHEDNSKLDGVLDNPFSFDRLTRLKIDINNNQLIDDEDITFLRHMYSFSEPYIAEQEAKKQGRYYPKPREFFTYLPTHEYVQPPLYLLNHPVSKTSPFAFLRDFRRIQSTSPYEQQLLNELYNEALRSSFAYALREKQLTDIERDYAKKKIKYCERLFTQKKYYTLLLNLIGLVEDGETLSIKEQSDFVKNLLYFRNDLKDILVSEEFKSFHDGQSTYLEIFKTIENALRENLAIDLDLNSLSSPRDFSDIQNYLDRAEWQVFKSKANQDNFKQLVLYAQYDRRYLRAVSRTSPKLSDIQLQNHNLPMILLFREALRISNNDKKAAVALLDEAIRIPLGWVKSIPKNLLPSSIALENFLLPGNKEDGLDKSRHWNVFGGVAIYKSPEESLSLALKRENMDLKEQNYSPEAMQEFLRDTIANINGIYYVASINPHLLRSFSDL